MAMSIQTSITASPAQGYAGTLDTAFPRQIATARNADSVSIGFGKGVVWDPSAPATDRDVTLPVSQTDKVMGIVVHSHAYSRTWTDSSGGVHGDLDATGLVPGVVMGILRQGRILVTAGSTVVAGTNRLYVRRAGGTLGALEGAADATNMIDCTGQGVWMSSVSSGSLAWLEVNFTTL